MWDSLSHSTSWDFAQISRDRLLSRRKVWGTYVFNSLAECNNVLWLINNVLWLINTGLVSVWDLPQVIKSFGVWGPGMHVSVVVLFWVVLTFIQMCLGQLLYIGFQVCTHVSATCVWVDQLLCIFTSPLSTCRLDTLSRQHAELVLALWHVKHQSTRCDTSQSQRVCGT